MFLFACCVCVSGVYGHEVYILVYILSRVDTDTLNTTYYSMHSLRIYLSP